MVRDSHRKIKSLDDLTIIAAKAREEGKSVILCHGVFDLVHMGHVRHFQKAREQGDILIATLTTEKYVNNDPDYLKGVMPNNIQTFKDAQGILDLSITKVYQQEAPLYSSVTSLSEDAGLLPAHPKAED